MRIMWISQATLRTHGYGRVGYHLRVALENEGVELLRDRQWGWDWRVVCGVPGAWYVAGLDVHEDLCIHTMFEGDPLPGDWAPVLNRVGLIWTPSTWCKELFERAGVVRPIEVSGYGVDPTEYSFIEREHDGKPYTFLTMARLLLSRKGTIRVIRAFCRLKSQYSEEEREQLRLIVKCNLSPFGPPGQWESDDLRVEFRGARSGPMNVKYEGEPVRGIYLVWGDLSVFEMRRLLAEADAFCYATSGEGFGLHCLEAMATGLPVITTYCTGQMEYLNEDVALLLGVVEQEQARTLEQTYGFPCEQAVPDEEEMVEHMVWCFEHQEEARRLGERAAAYVSENWTWQRAGQRAVALLEDYASRRL